LIAPLGKHEIDSVRLLANGHRWERNHTSLAIELDLDTGVLWHCAVRKEDEHIPSKLIE